jgi:hypothetical protein
MMVTDRSSAARRTTIDDRTCAPPGGDLFVNVVAVTDGHTHRVPEPLFAEALAIGAPLRAQCGLLILPASLAQPFGRPCLLCAPSVARRRRRTLKRRRRPRQ